MRSTLPVKNIGYMDDAGGSRFCNSLRVKKLHLEYLFRVMEGLALIYKNSGGKLKQIVFVIISARGVELCPP